MCKNEFKKVPGKILMPGDSESFVELASYLFVNI